MKASPFSPYQKFIIALLAFLQFTIILDFMILSPLGAMLMPALHITPAQFGWVVSAYAFSAGASGLLSAGFLDRFDRKKLLLIFYVGFIFGTLLCAIATSYPFLLIARMVTGLFGGVIGSIVFAITTDLFAFEIRGQVMGIIQTAFAASQILGIPVGLFLSNRWGWHMPFAMIVVVSILVGFLIQTYLKPIDGHLGKHPDQKAFHHLVDTLSTPRYLQAFCTTALLSTGGFMIMPFSSAFTVNNIGIDVKRLPMVYLATGLSAIFAGPLIGKLSDQWGKFKVFTAGSIITTFMIIIYTHLSRTPIAWLMLINIILFTGIFSRIIPAQALMSAIPHPLSRGAFMSISSSIQQMSGGLAAVVAGLIVSVNLDGTLAHFDTLGFVVVGANLTTLIMMYFIHLKIPEKHTVLEKTV